MRKASLSIALTAALIAATPAAADKISDAIRDGQQHYEDNRLSKAMKELRYAISQIGRKLAKAYEATFPEAPDGWEARKARGRSTQGMGMFGGTVVNRSYRQEGGRGRIKAELVVDNPMMQAFAQMFANPQLAAAGGYERARLRGVDDDALVKYDENTKRGEAILLMRGRVFIKVSGSNLESDEPLRAVLQGWKFKDLMTIADIK